MFIHQCSQTVQLAMGVAFMQMSALPSVTAVATAGTSAQTLGSQWVVRRRFRHVSGRTQLGSNVTSILGCVAAVIADGCRSMAARLLETCKLLANRTPRLLGAGSSSSCHLLVVHDAESCAIRGRLSFTGHSVPAKDQPPSRRSGFRVDFGRILRLH